MSLSAEEAPAAVFTCNGLPVAQVDSFKYLGLHFHRSRDIVHLIQPVKQKQLALGRLFSGNILCCSVVALLTFICSCCTVFWILLCTMIVRSGACTVLLLVQPSGLAKKVIIVIS